MIFVDSTFLVYSSNSSLLLPTVLTDRLSHLRNCGNLGKSWEISSDDETKVPFTTRHNTMTKIGQEKSEYIFSC